MKEKEKEDERVGKEEMKDAEKEMKKRYTPPRMEVGRVDVHAPILTLSDGIIGTTVDHDNLDNVFIKEHSSRSLWDIQW